MRETSYLQHLAMLFESRESREPSEYSWAADASSDHHEEGARSIAADEKSTASEAAATTAATAVTKKKKKKKRITNALRIEHLVFLHVQISSFS